MSRKLTRSKHIVRRAPAARRMSAPKTGFRIFLSYSHKDRPLVRKIVAILKNNGLVPMWDEDFSYGTGFHEQIRNFIAHAHVFLPIITTHSNARKWVHQEIGYAMAMNIPVLPLAIGRLPEAMLQQIHALRADAGDLAPLKKKLSADRLTVLIERHCGSGTALYQCADYAEARADMMARFADDVHNLGVSAKVRQKGGLSSFHIPHEGITHPVWKERYGNLTRSTEHCRLQRKERIALERHADLAGCRLIINPWLTYPFYGQKARISRLRQLLLFLQGRTEKLCQVAVSKDMDEDQSVTILGDWFAAESVSVRIGQGYRQTIFTCHAPSIAEKIEAFDQEFQELLQVEGVTPDRSCARAVDVIQGLLQKLQKSTKPEVRRPCPT